MILDSMDGLYFLVSRSWDGEVEKLQPGEGLCLDVDKDIALITTLETWSPVHILTMTSPEPYPFVPAAWEFHVQSQIEVSGPLVVANMEFDSSNASPEDGILELTPGAATLQVFARSAAFAQRAKTSDPDNPQAEQHLVVLSPIARRLR